MAENNSLFKVLISGQLASGNVEVVAEMPETVATSIEQEWDNPFKLEIGAKIRGGVQHLANLLGRKTSAKTGGLTLTFDREGLYTYMGGSSYQLTLDLEFVARDSVQNDIVIPVKNLIKLSCPSVRNDKIKILNAPPTCQISIGRFLFISEAIITSVQPAFSRPFVSDADFEGSPSRLPVTISIQTKRVMTQSRVDETFFTGSHAGLNKTQ